VAEEQRRATKQIRASEIQISRFGESLKNFADNAILKAAQALERGEGTVTEALQLLGRLDQALQGAGLGEFAGDLQQIYGDELRHIREALSRVSGRDDIFTDVDSDIITTLVDFDTDRVMRLLGEYTGDAKRTLLTAVMAGEVPDLNQFDDAFGSRFSSQLETELNTGLAGFSRSVNLYKAQELGLEYFLYVGPNDSKTREFCLERVGKVFTTEEISMWDNGQGLPASIYLGGYNCRHRLAPVRGK
jgi:hypothetical protein